jgi:hypothetical protein
VNTQHGGKKTAELLIALQQNGAQKVIQRRRWTTAMVILASLSITLATNSIGFSKNIIVGSGGVSQTGVLTGGGGGGGQVSEPDDPFSKPRKPDGPILDERTSTSIRFHWWDMSSYEVGYELYRGPAFSGPWTRIAVWGSYNGGAVPMSYTDSAVSRDMLYYYKVRAYNYYGESTTIQAFSTLDGRGVSRLQLRLHTANVSDANTDDDVNVSLRDYDNGGTWLDYGRNDFERGDEFTYELLTTGVSDLSDINDIYLLKPGTDGWCIESLALLADGIEIFTQQFGVTSSTCQWLDDENGHQTYFVVGRSTLRAHPLWQTYQQPIPSTRLLRTDLEDRIEGMVGNIIHSGVYVDAFPLYQGTLAVSWTGDALDGESHVKVSKKDAQAVHVEFNLDVDTPGPGGLTGGLDFDLRFTGVCRTATTPAKILMTTEHPHATADFDWTTEAMTLWLVNFLEDGIANRIKDSIPDLSRTITIDNKIVSCVTPSVDAAGSVFFDLTFGPATGTGSGTNTTGTVIGGASLKTTSGSFNQSKAIR